ncbi:TPA: DUF2703 domain-containing protein [Candidatus Micrarchaeota archaeon]|nr:DUF2703 domain-containing protein [Candidatus Micrarchaeota archaeon]
MNANKPVAEKSRELNINWQRLEIKGKTCPRCGSTETELEKAVTELRKRPELRGYEIRLKKTSMTKKKFDKNPLESNRIRINGSALDTLLNSKTGSSKCCGACGPTQCRTISVSGKTYETITANLIVKAALRATSIE